MAVHPALEPTYRKPIINVRLRRDGFAGGLNLPMHKYIRGLSLEYGLDSSFSVTIRLFDPEHDRVEHFLHTAGAKTEVYFSYGWRDLAVSREYWGLVKQYASKVTPGGNELEFTVQSPRAAAALARPDIVLGRRRVDDAVSFVCKQIGIPSDKTIIEPTVSTLVQIPDFLGSEGMTFLYWLSQVKGLAKSSRGNEYGGYTFLFDPDGTFRFTTMARADGIRMRFYDAFSYGFASDGRVLEFELLDSRPLLALTGGQYVVSRTVDPDDPNDRRDVVDPETGASSTPTESQGTAANQAEDQGVRPEQARFPVPEIVVDNDEALLRAISKWRLYTGYNFKVSMTILGDPHIRYGDFIYVRIVKRDGTQHFMSGLYLILNVSHEIDDSKYTTSLILMRRGSFVGDTVQQRIDIPSAIGGQVERTLPGFSVSPDYRFQIGRYYYSEDAQAIVFPEDGGETLELSPNITSRIPNYEPPPPGTGGTPFRHVPVESEEEE